MGFLDRFKRQPEPQTPEEVLEALVTAYTRQKWKRISSLCERHEQTILDNFTSWQTVPESIRKNRRRTDAYVHTLITVGQAFENAGFPELLQSMIGDEQSNPMLTWGDDLDKAQAFIDADDFQAAIELLTERLKIHEGHSGSGMDHFVPRTHGMIGIAYFHAGDLDAAQHHTKKALSICKELGDTDGIATYTNNLQQMVS
ncbi:MAG: tetratricopeptide repeat protein [Planctomycetaceae bacterium]|nr:tetratricopeptide repeat protein [Planctomycetaceae bacterium]